MGIREGKGNREGKEIREGNWEIKEGRGGKGRGMEDTLFDVRHFTHELNVFPFHFVL